MTPARKAQVRTIVRWLLGVTLLAPVLVLIAAFGTRFGLWSVAVGWDLLTWRAAFALSVIGAASGLVAALTSIADARRSLVIGLAALLVGGTVAYGLVHKAADRRAAANTLNDVSTDATDPPVFGSALSAALDGNGAHDFGGPQQCRGLHPVQSQVAPGVAAWALEQVGFTPRGAAAFRADGSREGFWFGFRHEAAIRIRPGRTDVRVAAVQPDADDGEACRLALRLVEALETPPVRPGGRRRSGWRPVRR